MDFKTIITLVVISFSPSLYAQEYRATLAGKRLVLAEATCAGMAFKPNNTVLLYDEMMCSRNNRETLKARVRWVTNNLFLITETEVITKGCPPRNWLYKVNKINGTEVELSEIWTGWNKYKDSISKYRLTN